ncbi:FAD-dependent oxidoreductase [Treponema sp. HNW]|uniref:NAD(P)/FAD-dependent oxidoreductase n=1 Tax=Treponema sp. HNW TaxID=3116654 RepID=UPI003D0ED7BF
MNYDVVIVGKGPAGISAALYLARAKYGTAVLGKDFGALTKAEGIENFYGLEKPLSGIELAERGIRQAENLGIPVIASEVVGIEQIFSDSPGADTGVQSAKTARFKLLTSDKREFFARTVLLATGKQRVGLPVPGFTEYQGRGISFCAVCDGFFYRNKKIGVVGNGFYAAAELNHLYTLTKDITLFTNGLELDSGVQEVLPQDIAIVKDKIQAIEGGASHAGNADGVQTGETVQAGGPIGAVKTSGGTYDVQGLFIALGTAGAADFAAKLGVQTGSGADAGTLIVNERFQTNLPGLYAAGDAAGGYLQIAKAVSDGAHAAKFIIQELRR